MQQAMLTDALGYVAAGLVFATFCAKRMASLRALAIVSNVAFIGYGFLDGLWPILLLHSAMLPMNIQRYRQSMRGHCSTTTADAGLPAASRSTLLRNVITVALGWFIRADARGRQSCESQIEQREAIQLKKRAGVVPTHDPTTPDLTYQMNRPDFRQKFIERQAPSPYPSMMRGLCRDALTPFMPYVPTRVTPFVPPRPTRDNPCLRSAPGLARHTVPEAASEPPLAAVPGEG